jgi:hypothetical protein
MFERQRLCQLDHGKFLATGFLSGILSHCASSAAVRSCFDVPLIFVTVLVTS